MECNACGYTGRSNGTWHHQGGGKSSECPKCHNKSPFKEPPGKAARARLISAAPELLEALLEAVSAEGPMGNDRRPDWWVKAVNACAKATGDAS